METIIQKSRRVFIEEYPVEIVERKGLGHPDTICDGIAEEIVRNFTRFYYEEFGYPLHFNLDKAVLVGGRSAPRFGGGRVLEPIEIVIAGRATLSFKGNERVDTPIGTLILKSISDYVRRNFRYLNPAEHIIVTYRVRPGSQDLVKLYEKWKKTGIPLANDTSIGVGYAPLSDTERACKSIEALLNDKDFKRKYPGIGEDVKVMCIRKGNKIKATVAMAVVDREVRNKEEYLNLKESVKEEILREVPKGFKFNRELEVEINVADDPDNDIFYITVTGTSAEAGDDGQIGRGNRANGLITPMRPMSIEAPAGKNAVSHVGKVYQIASSIIANKVIKELDYLKEIYVYLVSKIGKPITMPQIVYVEYLPEDESVRNIESEIESVILEVLDSLPKLWIEFMEGKHRTY